MLIRIILDLCWTDSTIDTDDDGDNDDANDDGGGGGGGDDDDIVVVVLVACSVTEFTCHNGRCVPRSRCNDRIDDCWDNSDETSCGIV